MTKVSKIMHNGCEYEMGGGGGGYFADVLVVGGGGGGGGYYSSTSGGYGGGNGGDINYVKSHIIQQTNDVVIGCGGAGGHDKSGNGKGCDGGMSKFGCLVANGGNGGRDPGNDDCNAQYSHLYNRVIRHCIGNLNSGCSGGVGGSSAVESGCGVNYCSGGNGARGFTVCLANCISLSIGGGGPGGYGCRGSNSFGYDGGATYPSRNANGYGGGGGGGNCGGRGGCGYQGIVIVQYPIDGSYGFTCATGGDCCVTCNGYNIHCFTSDGTFTIVE